MQQLSVLNFGDWAGYILLITLRILAVFSVSPIFKRAPSIAKIVLSICTAYILFGIMDISEPLEYRGVLEYALACLKELCLGATFSMIMYMCMSCVYLAGHMVDLNLGFGFSQLYDPVTNNQANITSILLNAAIILMFFTTDAHHMMFMLLKETFVEIPPGAAAFDSDFVVTLTEVFVQSFTIGMQISLPIVAVTLVIEVLLGVVMKSIPQLNFFIVGFPIKIIVGFMILYIIMPIFANYSGTVFEFMFTAIQRVFDQIGV